MTQTTEPQRSPLSQLVDVKFVVGLVLAGTAFYWTQRESQNQRIATIEQQARMMPEIRNREVDDLKGRFNALESWIRQNCIVKP